MTLISCFKLKKSTSMNTYAEVVSPCLVPLPNLKYCFALPALIIQDSPLDEF